MGERLRRLTVFIESRAWQELRAGMVVGRILKQQNFRHQNNFFLNFKAFESVMDVSDREEDQMIFLNVTAEMSREDVVDEVLKQVGLDDQTEKKKTKTVKVAKLKTDCKFCYM